MFKDEINPIYEKLEEHDKRFNQVNTKLESIEKNIKAVVIFFDKGYLGLMKRVEKIELHLGLSPFIE